MDCRKILDEYAQCMKLNADSPENCAKLLVRLKEHCTLRHNAHRIVNTIQIKRERQDEYIDKDGCK